MPLQQCGELAPRKMIPSAGINVSQKRADERLSLSLVSGILRFELRSRCETASRGTTRNVLRESPAVRPLAKSHVWVVGDPGWLRYLYTLTLKVRETYVTSVTSRRFTQSCNRLATDPLVWSRQFPPVSLTGFDDWWISTGRRHARDPCQDAFTLGIAIFATYAIYWV